MPDPLSKKLSRQLKRHLGSDNPEQVIQDIGKDANLFSEKLREFCIAIDGSYSEYDDRLKMAGRNIEISSRELNTTLRELEKLNATISAMLETLGQGLLFFDSEGICSAVYSKSCLTLFNKSPAGMFLPEVLGYSSEQTGFFVRWLKIAFDKSARASFQDLSSLLPQQIAYSDDRTFQLDYRRMTGIDKSVIGILVVVTDITLQLQANKNVRETLSHSNKIMQIVKNRNDFVDLVNELELMCQQLNYLKDDSDPLWMMALVHTLKGASSSMGLVEVSQELHSLEDVYQSEKSLGNIQVSEVLGRIEHYLEQDKRLATEVFGEDLFSRRDVVLVERPMLIELIKMLRDKKIYSDKIIEDHIKHHFLEVPLKNCFTGFIRELNRIAGQQQKPYPECIFSGDNIKILPDAYKNLFAALEHQARNIIDHGIETPSERLAAGKKPVAEIYISFALSPDQRSITITIADDGRGISIDYVRSKLIDRGSTDAAIKDGQDILQHLFDENFSLKTGPATLVSGRGIGLSAIDQEVKRMGGRVIIESDPQKRSGTRLILEIPVLNEI